MIDSLYENAYLPQSQIKANLKMQKKKREDCSVVTFYGRFLIISTSMTSTMMTKMNNPAIAGTK